jgi:hypothetical protein
MHQNELKFYRDILDTLNYILVFYHVKWSSGTYYFIWLKLLDKSVKCNCAAIEVMLETRHFKIFNHMVDPVIHIDKRE